MPISKLQAGGMGAGGLIQVSEGTGGIISVGGANARLLTGPNGRKVLTVELFRNLPVTAKLMTDTFIDLELGDIEALGPFLASITAHTYTQGISSANFLWRLVYHTSYDGKKFFPTSGAPNDVFSDISADGYAVQTALAPAGGFPLRMRFALAVHLGSTATDSAVVSCTLVLEFKS
ncbi:hypothetical protein L6R50_27845 [Myxococcota bacterium]|nr:hypothetical protein [Myxococcota bacterium]